MDGITHSTRKLRVAAVLAALVAFAATGAGHAESDRQLLAIAPVSESLGPVFVPSGAAEFEDAFAHLETPVEPVRPAHAVDITAIEPAATRDLGSGVASYYGSRFAGRPTANGERFDPAQLTAAHRTLPFGSRVRVTNPRNGRSVIVRINDRGPFHGNRTIDLSRAAAEQVGIVQAGHGTVELALVE